MCQAQEEWAQTADHIPILLRMETGYSKAEPRARFAITKMDPKKFRQAVKYRLTGRQELCPDTGEAATPRVLNEPRRDKLKRDWSKRR